MPNYNFLPYSQWMLTSAFSGIIVLFVIVAFFFWLAMLVDLVTRPIKNKTMWAIIICSTNIIGAALYYFNIYKHKPAENKRGSTINPP